MSSSAIEIWRKLSAFLGSSILLRKLPNCFPARCLPLVFRIPKNQSERSVLQSVAPRFWVQSNATYPSTSWLPDGAGVASDAMTLAQARGLCFSVCTAFQRSALAMIALAHGQAAPSADPCAWFDAEYITNFPKG